MRTKEEIMKGRVLKPLTLDDYYVMIEAIDNSGDMMLSHPAFISIGGAPVWNDWNREWQIPIDTLEWLDENGYIVHADSIGKKINLKWMKIGPAGDENDVRITYMENINPPDVAPMWRYWFELTDGTTTKYYQINTETLEILAINIKENEDK